MKKYLLLLFLLFFSTWSKAENAPGLSRFEEAYNRIYFEVAPHDINQALYLADSLLDHTSNDVEVIKTYMLKAMIHGNVGEVSSALINASLAEEVAEKVKSTEWQMRIGGFMSSVFHNVGLHEKALVHINKIEQLNKNDQNPLIQLFTHQDKAFYYINKSEPEQALKELEEAEDIVLKHADNGQIISSTFTTHQLKGVAYAQQGDLFQAKASFKKADEILPDQYNDYNALLHVNFIRAYLEESNVDSAIYYLSQPQLSFVASGFSNLNIELNELWSMYYELIGNQDSAIIYQNQYLSLKNERNEYLRNFTNEYVIATQEAAKAKKKDNDFLKSMILIALFSLLTIFVYFIYLKKKHQRRYNVFVAKMLKDKNEHNLEEEFQSLNKVKDEEDSNGSVGINVPEDTVKEILVKLETFEKGELYTKSDLTLSTLSSKLNINSKYLSHIINTYKKKDFNNYINELRVLYIVDKILTEEIYLTYKIAYLAEEAGFSSHSRFSSNFKKVTGTSPSVFIQERKKELLTLNP